MSNLDPGSYVFPSSRWREFPQLRGRLKGHWAIVRRVARDPSTGAEKRVYFEVARIARPDGDDCRLEGEWRPARLYATWVVPGDVPLAELMGEQRFFATRDELAALLRAGLEAFFAAGGKLEPWS